MYSDPEQWRFIRRRILEKGTPKKQLVRETGITAFFSRLLARFGNADYTFVRGGVISSSCHFFKGKTDGFETN